MSQSLHHQEVSLDLGQLLVVEHKRLHCELLPRTAFDASVHHPIRPFTQLLSDLVLLREELSVLEGSSHTLLLGLHAHFGRRVRCAINLPTHPSFD